MTTPVSSNQSRSNRTWLLIIPVVGLICMMVTIGCCGFGYAAFDLARYRAESMSIDTAEPYRPVKSTPLAESEATTQPPSEPTRDEVTYEIYEEWEIPNGGYGRVILVNPKFRNETDLRILGDKLIQLSKPDRNAFMWVYDDVRAAQLRKNIDFTEDEEAIYDPHFLLVYMRNINTGYHQLDIMVDGLDGDRITIDLSTEPPQETIVSAESPQATQVQADEPTEMPQATQAQAAATTEIPQLTQAPDPTSPSVLPTIASEPQPIGEPITFKDHTLTVNTLNYEGELLIINLTIINTGAEEMTISPLDFEARQADGTSLTSAELDCTPFVFGTVLPGDQIRGNTCWKGPFSDLVKIYYDPSYDENSVYWEIRR